MIVREFLINHPKYVDSSLVNLDKWTKLPLIDDMKVISIPTFERDLAEWITINCTKRFTICDTQYSVEDKDDIVAFKLTWLL